MDTASASSGRYCLVRRVDSSAREVEAKAESAERAMVRRIVGMTESFYNLIKINI
jgi:hypothetical protein